MADFTPGTVMTNFMACISILIDSASEILGTRLIPGTMEPSFISGINAVPRNGRTATVKTNDAKEICTVRLGEAIAKSSNFR